MSNKVTLITAEIKSRIKPMRGVVNSSTVLPILENGLFEIKDGKLKLTITDLETILSTEFSIGNNKADFSFTLDFKKFRDFVFNCESENFTMEYSKSEARIRIVASDPDLKVGLPSEDSDNYPKSPILEDLHFNFSCNSSCVIPKVKMVLPFVSNDDLRPAMTGILLSANEKSQITLVATDAHRLCKKELFEINSNLKMDVRKGYIIPQKSARIMCEIFKKEAEEIVIAGNDNHMRIISPDYTLICRFIDARFPDWTKVWPKELPYKFIAKRKQMKAMLNIALPFSNMSTHQVGLTIGDNVAEVKCGEADFDIDFQYRMPVYESVRPEVVFDLGLNGKFLVELLGVSKDEYVMMRYSSPTGAMIIDEDTLLMPLMLNR